MNKVCPANPFVCICSPVAPQTSFRYVALDRDDTLIQDSGYTDLTHNPSWLPGVFRGLGLLSSSGYGLVVLTNQSALAKGLYELEALNSFHKSMNLSLQENSGVSFNAFIVCPHLAEDGCECRKPATGMFDAAEKIYGLLPQVMFGNSSSDIESANAAGVPGVKVGNQNFYECVSEWLNKK